MIQAVLVVPLNSKVNPIFGRISNRIPAIFLTMMAILPMRTKRTYPVIPRKPSNVVLLLLDSGNTMSNRKGPKTKRMLYLKERDPHLHREFSDPVYQIKTHSNQRANLDQTS